MKITLYKSQRVESCDTEKAFAIQFSKYGNSMVFLSKKHCSISIYAINKDGVYWDTRFDVEIPDWLYNQMQWDKQQSIDLISKQWV